MEQGVWQCSPLCDDDGPRVRKQSGRTHVQHVDVREHDLAFLDVACLCDGLVSLNADHNVICALPQELFRATVADSLITLSLAHNALTSVPVECAMLHQLTTLDVSNNKLRCLPDELCSGLSHLCTLRVAHNAISTLPDGIGNLTALRLLHAASNVLHALPSSCTRLTRLRSLFLGNNCFRRLPVRALSGLSQLQSLDMSANAGLCDTWDNMMALRTSVAAEACLLPLPDQVEERIFIGSEDAARNAPALRMRGITHVVCACLSPPAHPDVFTYINVQLSDTSSAPLSDHFERVIAFVDDALTSDNTARVLFHCAAGVSRSSTLLIAYLMWRDKCTFGTALERVRRARPIVQPNKGFRGQLTQWYHVCCAEVGAVGNDEGVGPDSTGNEWDYRGEGVDEDVSEVVGEVVGEIVGEVVDEAVASVDVCDGKGLTCDKQGAQKGPASAFKDGLLPVLCDADVDGIRVDVVAPSWTLEEAPDPPQRWLHGSPDSVDVDVLYGWPAAHNNSVRGVPVDKWCLRWYTEGKEVGEDRNVFTRWPSGYVYDVWRGAADEVNNQLCVTAAFHDPAPVSSVVPSPVLRCAPLKATNAFHLCLVSLRRCPSVRDVCVRALRSATWAAWCQALSSWSPSEWAVALSEASVDARKVCAFQVAQTHALVVQGRQWFTKGDLWVAYPTLAPLLQRCDPVAADTLRAAGTTARDLVGRVMEVLGMRKVHQWKQVVQWCARGGAGDIPEAPPGDATTCCTTTLLWLRPNRHAVLFWSAPVHPEVEPGSVVLGMLWPEHADAVGCDCPLFDLRAAFARTPRGGRRAKRSSKASGAEDGGLFRVSKGHPWAPAWSACVKQGIVQRLRGYWVTVVWNAERTPAVSVVGLRRRDTMQVVCNVATILQRLHCVNE